MVNSFLNHSHLCSTASLILWFTFPFCNVHPVPDGRVYLTRACRFIKANSELWDGRLPPFRSRNTETICLETHYLALRTEGGFICASSKHFIAVQATSNGLRAVPGFTSGQACRCSIRAGAPTGQRWNPPNDPPSFFFLILHSNNSNHFMRAKQTQDPFITETHTHTHWFWSGGHSETTPNPCCFSKTSKINSAE